ncbi:MAG TPA: glycosyltransferase family 2 protein, partial [Polyangia bacterium]
DEAELLPRFLSQAAGMWDELCVVDTGSTDATRELILAAGGDDKPVKLIDRPWDGDFSAARNAGLALATGQWIVVLDADEMLSPEAVSEIREVAKRDDAGAATLRICNQMPHGRVRESYLLRMFRRDAGIRFAHKIHEEVTSHVLPYLDANKLALYQLDGGVEHLGYVRSRAESRGKKERDSELLRAAIAADGRDFYSWFKLLELGRFWSDEALLAEITPACLEALEAAGPEVLAGQPWAGDLIGLLAGSMLTTSPKEAIALMDRMAPHVTRSAAFSLRLGESHERAGNPDEADKWFRDCLSLASVTPDRQIATTRPLMGLARLALARPYGVEEAWKLTEQALVLSPRDPEALVSAASICKLAGGPALMDQFVRDYTARFGETAELHEAVASCA